MNAQYLGHVSLADGKLRNGGPGKRGVYLSIGGERGQLEPGVRRYGVWGGGGVPRVGTGREIFLYCI